MGWYTKFMIWYDAGSGLPIAPGEGEDGGPPSMDYYYCPTCEVARKMTWDVDKMRCRECERVLLVTH